jgi:hypothetical protein
MLRVLAFSLLSLYLLGSVQSQAQQRSTTFIRSAPEDEGIVLSLDKPVYFTCDTVRLTDQLGRKRRFPVSFGIGTFGEDQSRLGINSILLDTEKTRLLFNTQVSVSI